MRYKKGLVIPMLNPDEPCDTERWQITRERREVMEGSWDKSLGRYIIERVGASSAQAWGKPSQATNLYKNLMNQLAVLRERTFEADKLESNAKDYMEKVKPFSLHHTLLTQLVAYGDMYVYVGYEMGGGVADPGVRVRLVKPDSLIVDSSPSSPRVPIRVREAVRRTNLKNGKQDWVWDDYDLRDINSPVFRVLNSSREDVSKLYISEYSGKYPWVDELGPFIPWAPYHMEENTELWTPNIWEELLCGTYEVATLWTFWQNAFKTSSYNIKVGVDVDLAGGRKVKDSGETTRQKLALDPSSLLLLKTVGGGQQGMVTSLTASTDPVKLAQGVKLYLGNILSSSGLNAKDFEGVAQESGIAIWLKDEAKRQHHKRLAEAMEPYDEAYLRLVARVSNLFGKLKKPEGWAQLPTEGWVVKYPEPQQTPEEKRQEAEQEKHDLETGLTDRVLILMKREGLTEEQAIEKLQKMEERKRKIYAELTPQSNTEASQTDAPKATLGAPQAASVPEAAVPTAVVGSEEAVVAEQKATAATLPEVALNGAQVASAVDILIKTKASELPVDTSIEALVLFFNLSREAATRLVSPIQKAGITPPQEQAQPPQEKNITPALDNTGGAQNSQDKGVEEDAKSES